MARKKVRHELIANESARRATFKKRKVGLLKKMSEMKILCGVEGCVIIYDCQNGRPIVWPSSSEARCVLERFNDLPQSKQGKNMMDQETFLAKNIAKITKTLKNEQKKLRRIEMNMLFSECLATKSLDSLKTQKDMEDFLLFLDEKKKLSSARVDSNKSIGSPEVGKGE